MDFQKMIEKLIEAAKTEDWDFIDGQIPSIANDPEYLRWAIQKGIRDEDGNVRDLAASILEKTETLPSDSVALLYDKMKKDSNPYVKFRSAFALAGHGVRDHHDDVVQVLKEAQRDPEVAEIAGRYLENY